MPTLGHWYTTQLNDDGEPIGTGTIEVRRESDNGVATLKPARDGSGSLANPFTYTDATGFAEFYVTSGLYKIIITAGGASRTLRNIGIGLFSEHDPAGMAADIVFAGADHAGLRLNNLTSTQRSALAGAALAAGMVLYNTTTNVPEVYAASNWQGIGLLSTAQTWTATQSYDLGTSGVLQRWLNQESGKADYALALARHDGVNGATRKNNVLTYGYNVSASGGKQVGGDHTFHLTIESHFRTVSSINQLEFYTNYTSADNSVNERPFGIVINLDTHLTNIASRAQNTYFGHPNTTNDWLNLQSDATTGAMIFGLNSSIAFNAVTSTDLVTYNGLPMLGARSPGKIDIAAQSEELFLFNTLRWVDQPLTVWFGEASGQARGIRINTNQRFEVQTGGTDWVDMVNPPNYWVGGGGANIGIGPTSFTPDGVTLHIRDATASTGQTQLLITAGAGQGAARLLNLLDAAAGDLFYVDANGHAFGSAFRTLDGLTALNNLHSAPYNGLALATGGGVAFSSTGVWSGAIDARLERVAAGMLQINDGTPGTPRDLCLRNLGVGTASLGTSSVNVIAVLNGTEPGSSPSDTAQMYAKDLGSSSEMWTRNEGGEQVCFSRPPGFIVGGILRTASFNSTSDQAIAIKSPTAKYRVAFLMGANANASCASAVGGLYTGASKTGTAVISAATPWSALPGNTSVEVVTAGQGAGTQLDATTNATLYFSLTTPQGAPVTADLFVIITPIP